MSFRRVIKKSLELTMGAGALGCKIQVSGRLGGHEMARTESSHEGSIPLQTLRADINYGFALAITTHGAIGVKCWIYRGMLADEKRTHGARLSRQPRNTGESRSASYGEGQQ